MEVEIVPATESTSGIVSVTVETLGCLYGPGALSGCCVAEEGISVTSDRPELGLDIVERCLRNV